MSSRDPRPVPIADAPNGSDPTAAPTNHAAGLDALGWDVLRWMTEKMDEGTRLIPFEDVEDYFERREACDRLQRVAAVLEGLGAYTLVIHPPMPKYLEDALARGRPLNQYGTPECAAYVGWLQSQRSYWRVEPKATVLIRCKDGTRDGAITVPHGETSIVPRSAFATVTELAAECGVSTDAMGAALRKLSRKNPDCRERIENPRPREPRYLYRRVDVQSVLDRYKRDGRPDGRKK
jgi:hypothetical protein